MIKKKKLEIYDYLIILLFINKYIMNYEENLIEDINLEKYIKASPNPISIKGIETILFQMKYWVCKIYTKKGKKGSGFFVKIPCSDKKDLLPVLIANNHVIDNKYI